MSRLDELREKLYRKDDGGRRVKREEPRDDFYAREKIKSVWEGEEEKEEKDINRPEKAMKKKKLIRYMIFIGILAVLVFVGIIIFSLLGLKKEEMDVEIFSKNEIEAGENASYLIRYRNKSKVVLHDLEFSFSFPSSSVPFGVESQNLKFREKLDDLAPGEERETTIRAGIFGKEGEEKRAEVVIFYRPENLSARFSKTAEFTSRIIRVPLSVSFEVMPEVSSGQELEIILNYNSTARMTFENISLGVDYPAGFKFISSEPKPSLDNNIWNIGDFPRDTSGKIIIKGSLAGSAGEEKTFFGRLGIFDGRTRQWQVFAESPQIARIFSPPLFIEQKVNNSRDYIALPGEKLEFILHYKNTFNLPIKNITVAVDLLSPALDFATLLVEKGFFDSLTKKIIWNPGSLDELRELQPGEEGEFKFTIDLKPRPPIRSASDKNFVIVSKASIGTSEPPRVIEGLKFSSEDKLEIKLTTQAIFSARSSYRDSPITTSGPLPPKIGQTTVYTITWDVRNFSNDLKNFEVRAAMPPNVRWVSKIFPVGEPVSFNDKSSEIVWNIGTLPAGVGIATPAKSVAFQISLAPSVSDIGRPVTLVGISKASGIDTFTDKKVETEAEKTTTELKDDPLSKFDEWIVSP